MPAQPTAVPAGQVEVLEFFWYACPHCYAIDPLVESWKKTKPAYISFSRVHVMWNEGHRSLARLYLHAGEHGQTGSAARRSIQGNSRQRRSVGRRDPNNAAETERIQAAFVKKFGISEADFKKAYHSFDVDNCAAQEPTNWCSAIASTACRRFVVNGKYVADVASAGSPERLISLVGDLAAQEHKR